MLAAESFIKNDGDCLLEKYFQKMKRWDDRLCIMIFNWQGHKVLDTVMACASWIGNGFVYPLLPFVIWFDRPSAGKNFIFAGLASYCIEMPVYLLTKFATRRPRPYLPFCDVRYKLASMDPYSFPSGHAASAFLMAVLTGHFYPALTIPLCVTATLIGVSRVYKGLHYPSDVVAGSVLGVASARIGLFIVS
jgi:undecaprenyl-diphosphatase